MKRYNAAAPFSIFSSDFEYIHRAPREYRNAMHLTYGSECVFAKQMVKHSGLRGLKTDEFPVVEMLMMCGGSWIHGIRLIIRIGSEMTISRFEKDIS